MSNDLRTTHKLANKNTLNVLTSALIALFIISPAVSPTAQAGNLTTPFLNLGTIATQVGLDAYIDLGSRTAHPVKVAILDNGFRNYTAELGKTLPSTTTFHAGPVAVDAATEESHGLFMAQLVAGLLGRADHGALPYELHLFSTFGYSNLKAAVETVVKEKYDIVLYAQVWEYGGNSDGRGFINALVSQAVSAGALWINAAGNFGDATFRTAIERTTDDWAKLPGPNNSVRVRCLPKPAQAVKNTSGQTAEKSAKCDLRAVLSWNDFKDDVAQGTDKDLDFVLTDDTLQVIQTSGLKQKKEFPDGEAGSSLYSREIIQAQVNPGLYYLRVKMRSDNFNKLQDEMRITTSGDLVKQLDLSPRDETILPPADNSGVVTVGASDSEKSAAARHLGKPELLFPSEVKLTGGDTYRGSSNSAAIAAAAATVLKSLVPTLNRRGLLTLLTPQDHGSQNQKPGQNADWTNYGEGLPISQLQFRPTGPGCFQIARLPYIPPAAVPLLRTGAVTVLTDHGVKILTASDPFSMVETGTRRQRPDDLLAVGAQGFFVIPRANQLQLDPTNFEVVQLPRANMICKLDGTGPVAQVPSTPPTTAGTAAPQLKLPSLSRID